MMYLTSLKKVGKSVVMTVPPALLDLLHIGAGAEVGLTVDGERLLVKPQQRSRYTLDELLAQCDPSAEMVEEDREWLDSRPVGTELL